MATTRTIRTDVSGSNIDGSSMAGDLDASGELADVMFSSQSAGAEVETVHSAHINSMSGDINVGNLTGRATLKSMSGSITVHGPIGAYAQAGTMSGNVTGSGGLNLDGSSMTGRVRNRT